MTASAGALALGLSGFSGACGGSSASPSEAGAPSSTPANGSTAVHTDVAAGVDIGRIIERVHFAFRPAAGGTTAAGHTTYTVRADATGAVTVTPARPTADHGRRFLGRATTFTTTAIGRVGATTTTKGAEPRIDDEGGLTIARGVADERWSNHDDGTRVAWTFASKPAGNGDLLIRVALTGSPFTTKTSGGAHFFDRETGLGLRYGRATWVDATGKGTDVAMEVQAGTVVLRVPSAVVDASSWPARLDPTVSPEIAIDDPVRSPETRGQAMPTIATDGTDYFVVWTDNIYVEQNEVGAIRGTRITAATGAVLDIGGLDLAASGKLQGQTHPHVAYDDKTKQYVVAWTNTNGKPPHRVVGARVLPTGVVVDPQAFVIHPGVSPTPDGEAASPNISCATGTCLVVFATNVGLTTSRNVVGVPLAVAASSPVGASFNIAVTANDEVEPAVAMGMVRNSGGKDLAGAVVTWRAGSKVHARQLYLDGTFVEPVALDVVSSTSPISAPVVGYDGAKYLIAWTEEVDQATNLDDVQGANLVDGVVEPPFPIAATFENQRAPTLTRVEATAGAGFLVTWEDRRTQLTADIYGAYVGDPTIKQGGPGKTSGAVFQIATGSRNEAHPTVACATTNCFVAWEVTEAVQSRFGALGFFPSNIGAVDPTSDIVGARVTKAFGGAPVLDPGGIVLSTSANGETGIVSASDGKSFLLAWNDSRNDTTSFSDVFGAIVTPSGDTAKLTTPGGIAIATASGAQQVAGVVFDGTNYLVVWNDESNGASQADIYARRFTPKGVPLTANPFAVSVAAGRQSHATIAFDKVSKRTLVAWIEDELNGGIRAALVANDDTLVKIGGLGTQITVDPVAPSDLTAASAGGGFLLAWSTGASCAGSVCAIGDDVLFTTQIDSNGKVAPVLRSAETGYRHLGPAIGSDGNGYLLAWRRVPGYAFAGPVPDGGPLDAGGGIVVASFASDGGNLMTGAPDAARFSALVEGIDNVDPRVGHDGYTYVVLSSTTDDAGTPHLAGQYATADGRPAGSPVSAPYSTGATGLPSADRAGRVLVPYAHLEKTQLGLARRAKGAFFQNGALLGAACTVDTECVTRKCLEGECSKACVADDDCIDTQHCNAGFCKKRGTNGATCKASTECASGQCVEGVCCDTGCGGCSSCKVEGHVGTCSKTIQCGAECADDGHSLVEPTTKKPTEDCAPFKCGNDNGGVGSCKRPCTSVNDCIAPAVCDESRQCVAPPSDPNATCAASPTPKNSIPGVLGSLAAAAAFLLRRRRRG